MTVADLERQFIRNLVSIYDKSEATAITRFALDELLTDDDRTRQQIVTDDVLAKSDAVMQRLLKQEPVQYIFETAWFCNLRLKVNNHVLIPRPETEELVHIIKQSSPANARILDIGTGSGCIALGLKYLLPEATVAGVDNSEDALTVARKNATQQRLAVNFHHLDILYYQEHLDFISTYEKFEIIVSNPPYIPLNEKAAMPSNVTAFEPHEALFVDSENSLLYYDAISDFALKYLAEIGQLFFEVHQDKASSVVRLLTSKGFRHVNSITDMSGNERFVVAHIR